MATIGDRLVLPPEIRRGALLHGAGDLAHPLVPGRLPQQPDGEPDAVGNGERAAEEREENCVISEEVQCARPLRN